MQQAEPEDRTKKIKKTLIRLFNFFSKKLMETGLAFEHYIISIIPIYFAKIGIAPAATNGREILIDPEEFFEMIQKKEEYKKTFWAFDYAYFTIFHEALHIMFAHMDTEESILRSFRLSEIKANWSLFFNYIEDALINEAIISHAKEGGIMDAENIDTIVNTHVFPEDILAMFYFIQSIDYSDFRVPELMRPFRGIIKHMLKKVKDIKIPDPHHEIKRIREELEKMERRRPVKSEKKLLRLMEQTYMALTSAKTFTPEKRVIEVLFPIEKPLNRCPVCGADWTKHPPKFIPPNKLKCPVCGAEIEVKTGGVGGYPPPEKPSNKCPICGADWTKNPPVFVPPNKIKCPVCGFEFRIRRKGPEGEEGGIRVPYQGDVHDRKNRIKKEEKINRGIDFGKMPKDEFVYRIKKEMERARSMSEMSARMRAAGTMPGLVGVIVEATEEYKIRWDSIIRSLFSSYGSRFEYYTWSVPSRKLPGIIPGHISYGSINVRVLVDTSGSITDEELQYFVSEIYNMSKLLKGTVYVYPWDVMPYETVVIRCAADAKQIKMSGRGGTQIGLVLKKVLQEIRPNDVVVILSDWIIDDLTESIELLEELSRKAGMMILVSVDVEPPKIHKAHIIMTKDIL